MIHVLDVLVKKGYVIAEKAEGLSIIAEGTGDGFKVFEFRPDKSRSTKKLYEDLHGRHNGYLPKRPKK